MNTSVLRQLRACTAVVTAGITLSTTGAMADEPLTDWSGPRPITISASGSAGPLPTTPDQFRAERSQRVKTPAQENIQSESTSGGPSGTRIASAKRSVAATSQGNANSHRIISSMLPQVSHLDSRDTSRERFADADAVVAATAELVDVPHLPARTLQQSAPTSAPKLTPPNINTVTVSGWQLGRLAAQKIARSEALFQRGSPMAARQHAIEAIHLLAQATDELSGSRSGTIALSQAMTAVREASDFLGRFGAVDLPALKRLVDAHQTPVLRHCELESITALRAADTYYEFARCEFEKVVKGWPIGSRGLYVIAKTEPLAQQQPDNTLSAAQVCYLRAAVVCNPADAQAARELGHELLAVGMYDEARWALENSYSKQPSEAALVDLAELHRVLGNHQLAQQCTANIAMVRQQTPRVAQVIHLDPSDFAKASPMVMSQGQPGQQPAAAETQTVQRNRSTPHRPHTTRAATQPNSVTPPAQPTNPQASRSRVARALDQASGRFRSIFQ